MNKMRYALLLLFPCLFVLITSVLLPIIVTFTYSLKKYNLTKPLEIKFNRFDNYNYVLHDDKFYTSLINSLIILIVVILLGTVVSLTMAIVLNRKGKFSSIFMAIAIVPWALPPLVNGIIWKFIFFSGYGLLNKILININFINEPIAWTSNRWTLLVVISVIVTWRIVPFCAVIFLANLKNIPNSYYESLMLDGYGKIKMFKIITLPLLLPSFAIVFMNLTATALNVFDEVVALVGYQFEGQTLLVYNYLTTFQFLEFGIGSAISYMIMLITGIFGYYYVKNMTVEKVY